MSDRAPTTVRRQQLEIGMRRKSSSSRLLVSSSQRPAAVGTRTRAQPRRATTRREQREIRSLGQSASGRPLVWRTPGFRSSMRLHVASSGRYAAWGSPRAVDRSRAMLGGRPLAIHTLTTAQSGRPLTLHLFYTVPSGCPLVQYTHTHRLCFMVLSSPTAPDMHTT